MVTPLRHAPLSASTRACFRTGLRPLVAALLLALGPRAFALPTDPTVVAGQAVVRGAGGNSLVIDQASGKAAIDWRSFNIGAGEAVRFNQPSAAAMTVNRVTSNNPSEILGLISAPGTVFLINPTGIIFGRTAVVDVGSLVASTLSASTADLLSGRAVFNATPGGSGAVRNEGSIISAPGGSVSLIGTQVSNSGSIATPGGTTGLIAGERVSVDFEGDGLVRYQVDVGAARALVEQSGQISADGGRVALQAGARDALVDTVLNVDGVVRARGISQRGGEIYLDGGAHGSVMVSGMLDASGTAPGTAGGQLRVLGENVGLIGGARLDASGDAGGGSVLVGGNYQGSGPEHNATRAFVGSGVTINADALSRGDGGRVITWADDWTRFYGTISARGGAVGGDGGFVEVSGKQNLAFAGSVVTSAPRGRTGTLLLDPGDLYVGANPGGGIQPAIDTDGTAGFLFEANGGPLLRRDFYVLASSLSSDSKYVLRAQDNVFFNADVAFGTTGGDAAKFVSVEAGEAIRSEPGVTSISTAGGALSLNAGTTIDIGAAINTNGGVLTINSAGAAALSGGVTGVGSSLVKQGAGELSLSGSNTYSGGTIIRVGTLRTAAASALPEGGAVSLEGSAVLNLDDKTQGIGNLSGASGTRIALGAAGTGGLAVNQTSDDTFAGQITGSGPASGTAALSKTGAGVLTLSGANSFTGLTQVSEGALRVTASNALAAASSLEVTGTGTFEIDGVALNSLASLTLTGGLAGLETLAGRGTASYGGTVTMVGHARMETAGASDTLTLGGQIDGRTDVPTSAAPILQKVGGGVLVLDGTGSLFYPQILAGTLRATSDGVLPNTETLVGPGATLDIANTTQSIAHLSGGDAASRVLLGASGQLTVNQGLENAYAGSISGGAASVFAKAGNATLHLSGASPDYFGVTRVQAGTLSVSGSGNVLGSGGVEVSDGATLDIDAVNLGVTSLQLTGSGVGGSGALTGAGAARYDGTVSLNDPGPVVLGVADGGYLTLGGPLSGGVAMSVVKQGLGTLGLRDSAGFGGGTTIAAGTLVAQHASALGGGGVLVNDGASLLIDSVTLTTGGLTLNGRGVQEGGALQGAGTAAHAGAVTLNTASAIGAAAGSTLTLNNPLTGPGGLAKVGSGRLDLTAGSSYAGGTTIEAGTLVAQHASALGGGGVLVNDGASLLIDSVTLTTGGLTLNGRGVGGAGALQGTGTAGHSGPVTIATASAIGAPTLADMLTFDSPVTGPGSLSKVGLGVVELWGNNSYANGTTIESSTLRLLSGASLSGGGAVSLTGTGIFDLNDTRQSIGNLAGAIGTQIALGSGGAGGLTVNQTSDGSFAGVISGSGSGTGALNKLGSGTLTLSGANTFTGLTRVSEGVLRVSNPNALAAASSLLVTNTGTFEIDGVAFNSLASLTLTGDQAGLETLAGRGAASYAGTVTLLGLGRVAAAGASDALTLSGHIDGHSDAGANPALTKAGAGTVTLSGINNGYAGGTTIAAGTLVVQQADALGSGTVTVNDGATLEIDNVMLATAGLTLNGSGVGGAGALQGVGAAGHAGPITLATTSAVAAPTLADTLTFDSPVTGPGSLNKLGLGVVNLWGSNRYAGGTTIAAGTLRLLSGASLPGGGAVSLMGTGILDLNDTSQTIGNLSGEAGTRIALGSGNLTVSQGSAGSFAGRVDGSGNLTKQGTARLSLSGANTTYSGTTRVLAGTLTATGSGSALGSGAVQVSGGATLEIDNVALSTGGLTLNGRGVSGAGALRGSGTASHTGTVTLATASAIGAATLTDTLSLNNPVTGLGLTKVGSGTVNLSGSNRYVGGTTIEAGTLRLLGGATLPSLGAVNLTGSGILDLNNTNQSIGDLAGTVGTRIDLGSGDLTVTQAAAGSFAGRVAGSGDLTKQGTAQLSLSGASSGYSGTTRVEAGTLVATGSGSALGTGAVQVSDGATLALDDITLGVSSISLQGHGVGGLGVLTGTGAAAYAGSLALDGPASIGVAAAGDTLSLGGAVSGGALARLTKLGAGTLSLSAASPYAGGTTISAGHLVAAGSGALGSGAVRVAGGALDVGAATLGNSIVLAGGALNAVGSALLTGAVSQLADSRISAAQAPASLTLQQAFAGGGHTLSVAGPGRVSLAGGAAGLASIVQDMGSELRLGDGKSIISSGAQIYSGVVKGLNATLASTALNAIAATGSGNDFTGTLHVTAGDTTLSDSNALSVVLDTGATKLTAGQALAVSGTAASLVTDSEALVFGDTLVTGNGSFTARGAVSQLAGQALQVGGTTTVDATGQTVSLTEAGNKFDGLVTVKAGQTDLSASDNLNVALDQIGATTLTAGQALTLAGSAASLVTDSAALTFGVTRVTGDGSFTARGAVSQLAGQALQVGGATTFDAGSQTLTLTEASNTFGGLVTVKAGDTALRSRDSLNVALSTGATTLIAGQALTLGGTAASLVTDSAALTFGTTRVVGDGSFTARGPVSQLANGTLVVDGRTQLDITLRSVTNSIVLANRGNVFGGVLAGEIDLGPGAADSSIRSEQAITLGALDVRGKGVLEIESHADMAKILVPDVATVLASSNGKPCDTSQSCVSVQLNEGTPQRLSVYEASISQLAGTRISTEPEATLSLRASGKGSIDLSAEALVEVTPAGGVESSVTGPAGLLSVYSRAGSEQRVLTHAGGTTNTIQGPLAAVTQANTSQDSPDKTVVVVASDTIRVAAKDGIDGDTVMLMAREIAGGGGKIQTHVAATGMRDGRNIRTGVDPNPDQNYSILPSIFVIADAPGDTSATYSFGSLGNPISMSFGYVGTPVANSLLQTIAVEPYRRGDPAGAVPVYLDTRVQVGVDPKGPIRRFLVFPAGTPTGSIRMVVVDGVEILDSSAFASVQSAVAELLNQVRKEQLESGFSNENVAAQLRKGVITETRVGPAAVDRFQGVAPAGGCVGTMIGEMLVCAPAAGPQQP